jgi:hypothetical protein
MECCSYSFLFVQCILIPASLKFGHGEKLGPFTGGGYKQIGINSEHENQKPKC